MTNSKLVLLASVFLMLFGNVTFFNKAAEIYTPLLNNIVFLGSVALVLASFIALLLTLVTYKHTTKPLLVLILLISSVTSYFIDSYGLVIDDSMIQNIVQTNLDESLDLFNLKLLGYFLVLGILPSFFVYRVAIKNRSPKAELVSKFKLASVLLLIIVLLIFIFSKSYASMFREQKLLRYYTNPTYYIYSIGTYIHDRFLNDQVVMQALGEDANIPAADIDRELIILVVGEAARADRFSLNGYGRETNPLLKKEGVINFSNMQSCGTSTAVSVPCMFSNLGRGGYSDEKNLSSHNLLDVLQHAGVHILWRDNNSDSKGVALRVPYQDFKSAELNPVCDVECRDEGMLIGLQEYIAEKKSGDVFIVLHQMGNHGPAYYKRYPKSFERFTPVCTSSQLEQCSNAEIGNAYDNAILYTDYFLSKVIGLLKRNTAQFETAMIYISDHGESLGENGLYLHGLPYLIAPREQRHIAALMWFGDKFHGNINAVRAQSDYEFSHDNLFHTTLGLFEVETAVYDNKKDIINQRYPIKPAIPD